MNFHWPSFLLGYGSGIATALLGERLKPVLVELASLAYQMFDSVGVSLASRREDLEDVLAEARARVRGETGKASEPRSAPKRSTRPVKRAGARSARRGGLRPVEKAS